MSGSALSAGARAAAPRTEAIATGAATAEHRELDLRGVLCPLNWVRARLALERMPPGSELVVWLDPGEPLESVPRSARDDGHQVSVRGETVTIVKR